MKLDIHTVITKNGDIIEVSIQKFEVYTSVTIHKINGKVPIWIHTDLLSELRFSFPFTPTIQLLKEMPIEERIKFYPTDKMYIFEDEITKEFANAK